MKPYDYEHPYLNSHRCRVGIGRTFAVQLAEDGVNIVMAHVDEVLCGVLTMQKTFVIIGNLENKDHEEFKEIYLNDHKQQLLKNSKVKRYVANIIEEPSDELVNSGWGWGERDTAGIKAIDEIWCEEDYRPESMAVIKEDTSRFIGKFVALLAGEYIQR